MITPHACRRTLAVLATALSTASAFADVPISQKFCTVLDVPVAGVTNRAYLTSLSSRPWWNRDWTRRAPILVSTESDVAEPKAIVDAIVDFGEEVRPEDVRVVTPWETEVACVAERVQSSKVRLIFQAPLRVRENKPFLVYWGRKNGTVAGASSPRESKNQSTTVQPSTSNLTPTPPSP